MPFGRKYVQGLKKDTGNWRGLKPEEAWHSDPICTEIAIFKNKRNYGGEERRKGGWKEGKDMKEESRERKKTRDDS